MIQGIESRRTYGFKPRSSFKVREEDLRVNDSSPKEDLLKPARPKLGEMIAKGHIPNPLRPNPIEIGINK